MVTEILKNGCHKTKMVRYRNAFGVEPVKHFCPKHDFSTDIRYAELCAPLDYRDIEFAKRASIGDIAVEASLQEVCPGLSKKSLSATRSRIFAKTGFRDLYDFLKRLCFDYKFTGDLDEEKLLKHLEESIEAVDPGPQKFAMCVKLLEIRGHIDGGQKKKRPKSLPDPADQKSPKKWSAALKDFDAQVKTESGNGS